MPIVLPIPEPINRGIGMAAIPKITDDNADFYKKFKRAHFLSL